MADTPLRGMIESVSTENARSFLAADAAMSDTVIQVQSAEMFELAGQVSIDDAIYDYAANPETDTLTLSPALLAAVGFGEPVEVYPPAPETTALVSLPGASEPITARVALAHIPMLTPGTRDVDQREVVTLYKDGSQYVTLDVPNTPARIASTALTGPAPDGWGGGASEAPTTAPGVSAAPFAVATVRVTITPLDPALEARYEVAASLTSPVAEDGSATVGTSVGTTYDVATLGGVQIPFDAPTYLKVRAVNDIGAGPWSSEVSATPRKADNEYISSLYAYLGRLEANQVTAGTFEADLALVARLSVGNRIEISGSPGDTFIRIYATELDAEGNKIPLIELRPEGSIFRGRVEADDVSILQGLILQGETLMTVDSTFTMRAGATNPTIEPALSATTLSRDWPTVPIGYDEKGITRVSSLYWTRLLVPVSGSVAGTCIRQWIDTSTWAVTTSTTLANVPSVGEIDMRGTAYNGTNGYTYAAVRNSTGWRASAWSSGSGSYVGSSSVLAADGQCTVGLSATGELLFARSTANTIEVRALNPATMTVIQTLTVSVPSTWSKNLYHVSMGEYDLADGLHLVIVAGQTVRVWKVANWATTPSATQLDGEVFDLGTSVGLGGFDYDPDIGRFCSVVSNQSARIYSGWRSTVHADTAWAAYYDTDGTLHTTTSPLANFTMSAGRRFVQVTLSPLIDTATHSVICTVTASGTPALTDLGLRTLGAGIRSLVFDPSETLTPGIPPTTNTFAAGTASVLAAESGGFTVNGASQGDWPPVLDPMRDRLDDLEARTTPMRARHMRLNASQNASDGVDTRVTSWVNAPGNPDAGELFTTSSGLLTCVTPGWYDVFADMRWNSASSGYREVTIEINSSIHHQRGVQVSVAGSMSIEIRRKVYLDVADVLSIGVKQNSGSTLAVFGGAGSTTASILEVTLVGSA